MTRTLNQQRYIDAQKKSRMARRLSDKEKPLDAKLDSFFQGKSTDNREDAPLGSNPFMQFD